MACAALATAAVIVVWAACNSGVGCSCTAVQNRICCDRPDTWIDAYRVKARMATVHILGFKTHMLYVVVVSQKHICCDRPDTWIDAHFELPLEVGMLAHKRPLFFLRLFFYRTGNFVPESAAKRRTASPNHFRPGMVFLIFFVFASAARAERAGPAERERRAASAHDETTRIPPPPSKKTKQQTFQRRDLFQKRHAESKNKKTKKRGIVPFEEVPAGRGKKQSSLMRSTLITIML